jgi:hypothetical protein
LKKYPKPKINGPEKDQESITDKQIKPFEMAFPISLHNAMQDLSGTVRHSAGRSGRERTNSKVQGLQVDSVLFKYKFILR